MSTTTTFSWLPSTRAEYDRALAVLPPAFEIGSGFLLGEPFDHDHAGRPRFTAYRRRPGEEYQAGSTPITVAEFRVAMQK